MSTSRTDFSFSGVKDYPLSHKDESHEECGRTILGLEHIPHRKKAPAQDQKKAVSHQAVCDSSSAKDYPFLHKDKDLDVVDWTILGLEHIHYEEKAAPGSDQAVCDSSEDDAGTFFND